MEKNSYFYVLHCQDGSFYGGYTTDLNRREQEHNQGVGAKYTKPLSRRPVRMIYAEAYATRSEATSAEYAFKKQTRQDKVRFLKKQGVTFPLQTNQPCKVMDHTKKGEPKDEEPEKL